MLAWRQMWQEHDVISGESLAVAGLRIGRAEHRWLQQHCLHEIAEDVPCTTLPLCCRHEFSEHIETCSLAFLERQAPARVLLLRDVVQRCTLLLQPGEDVRFIDLPL